MKKVLGFPVFALSLAIPCVAGAVNLCDQSEIEKLVKALPRLNDRPRACLGCPEGDGAPVPVAENRKKWKLVWQDDFNYSGRPDPAKWTFEIGGHGWGNEEDQYYTDRLENAHVENGRLVIEARKEKYENRNYTSARINSKAHFTYGRIEYRAKLPRGRGSWPAAWVLPVAQKYGDELWPDNGEMDLIEAVGHEPNVNHVSLHTRDNNFWLGTQRTAVKRVPGGDEAFHNYAVEWLPNQIQFFQDGQLVLTATKSPGADWKEWPFDQNMRLVLSLTVGGFWGRGGGIDDTAFPMKFEFEHVRVYAPADPAVCGIRSVQVK